MFSDDLKFGKQGEEKIYQYLLTHPNTKYVIDTSDDIFFQSLDIDFLWQTKNNKIYKLEIKTDRLADKTKNIIYEYYSNKTYQTEGCFEKTEADYILYYIINENYFYNLNVKKLRQYVNEKKDKLKIKYMGDDALGYIIPIRLIEKYRLGKKIMLDN